MLHPLANLIMSGGDPIAYFLQFAKDLNAITKAVSLARSKTPIVGIAQIYSSLLPSTKISGEFNRTMGAQTGEPPRQGLSIFTDFFSTIMTSHDARMTLLKNLKSANPKISPPMAVASDPNISQIERTIQNIEIFGMAGKAQPLFGDDITPILASRFSVEHYLFSDPVAKGKLGSSYEEDNRVAAAIWYLMYDAIVQTPESYDATLPLVPPSPQDAQIATQILKMLGTLTHTSVAVSTAPLYLDSMISLMQAEELLEFIKTGPIVDDDLFGKCSKALDASKAIITENAYAPIVTLARSTFDYVKQLTGARYLLPEFLVKYSSTIGETPFTPLKITPTIKPDATYRGYVDNAQRITAFGGLDIPQLLANLSRRIFDIQAGLIQLSQVRATLQAGLPSSHGSVIYHLDSLGLPHRDPPLSTDVFEYPDITRTYLTPSYVKKYVLSDNRMPRWNFSDGYLFKPFFSNPFHMSQLQQNTAVQAFSWDTDVQLPPSPATGAEFAALMIPFNYTSDCAANNINNDIASVGQFLAMSPHRPMKDFADYFTALFRSLSTGLNDPEIIANALASMFSLYRRKKKGTGVGKFNDASAWEVVKPQIPAIYGYPTSSLLMANAPWTSDAAYECTINHVLVAPDGSYMLVLHRAIPKPTALTYIPFTMKGGVKVSLPISQVSYSAALSKIHSTATTPASFYSEMFRALSSLTVDNGLMRIDSWAPCVAYYPHIFVTNRHVTSSSGSILSALPYLTQKLALVADDAAPFGGVLSYYQSPLIAFDLADEDEAITSSSLELDLIGVLRKRNAPVVDMGDPEVPKTEHSDEPPVNTPVEAPVELPSSTNADGSQAAGDVPPVGSFDPTEEINK